MSTLAILYLSCPQRYQTDPLGLVPALSQAHLGHLHYTHGEQSPWSGGPSCMACRLHGELCPVVAQHHRAQCPAKPDRLPLATPKIQAVRQRVQSKTSDQSHCPSHPPLPTWGTLEMFEHTRERSSTWSATTVIKRPCSTCLTRKKQLRTQNAGPLFSFTAAATVPCCR